MEKIVKRMNMLLIAVTLLVIMMPTYVSAKNVGKPRITSVSATENTVTVKWKKVKNAKNYKVYNVTTKESWKYWKSVKKNAANEKLYADTTKYKVKSSGGKYKVYKKTTINDYRLLKKTKGTSISFNGEYNTKYTIVVRAYNGKKAGEYSQKKTITTKEMLPQYDYELKFLNEPFNYKMALYVKTDDPTEDFSLKIFDENGNEIKKTSVSCGNYADLNLSNIRSTGWNKVDGGYLRIIRIGESGMLTFSIQADVRNQNGKSVTREVFSEQVYVRNYFEDKHKWMQMIIDEVTTETMTKKEKMQAITRYMADSSMYYKTIKGQPGYVFLASEEGVPGWVLAQKEGKYRYNSFDSPYLLVAFGEMIGYPMTSLYPKYDYGTPEWERYHYYAVSDEDGSYYAFCQIVETGYIEESSIKQIDFSTYPFYDGKTKSEIKIVPPSK